MPTLVVFLRAMALLAFAAPALILYRGRSGASRRQGTMARGERAPVVANFLAAGLFFPALFLSFGDPLTPLALPLALAGCVLAFIGAALVTSSRKALGAAWSLVASADANVGLVTNGPYRFVRHPIYLGLILMGAGQAIAYGSGPAMTVAALGLAPTFVWRAMTEERLLASAFGKLHAEYRSHTRLIIPGVL